ncbi:MAG: rhomboid family intramembrane serine protease [Lachnospiraceae bacterium]|nr:rhomboid family intramembrane serine protease [Lachnospiraceae bacterium]
MGLILINAVVFVLVELGGSSAYGGYHMYRWGAMLTSAVSERHEYWRLFTSIFLHFGIEHLAGNMLVLFALGSNLEHGIGHLRFGVIYLLSGVGANVFSQLWNLKGEEEILSAGASGAVFGIMGAMVFAGLFAKEWIGSLSPLQVVLMLALSLYHGVNEAVDDTAHLSGLAIGFLLAILLLKVFPGSRSRKKLPSKDPSDNDDYYFTLS